MPISSKKITAFAKTVASLPNKPRESGMTGDQVKAQIDSSPEELRKALNGLIDILISTTTSDSGAQNIGSETITGVTGATVRDQLIDLKAQIDGVSAGAIPDGSVTASKLKLGTGLTAGADGSINANGGSSINSPLFWI